ncbi:GLAA [Symbiodinium natans]|uniref:GLAA protein n=1 Tax=Symbiodinium natans TaxID=878477 RepID=A0A812RZ49_9DINO|nr:GLAA [Symbiodinium natans]
MAGSGQLQNSRGQQGQQMSKDRPRPDREKYRLALAQRQVRMHEAAWDECIRRELAAAEAARAQKASGQQGEFYEFSVQYATSFGQELYMVGSCEELGSWTLSHKVHMGWSEGNIWRAKVEIPLERGVPSLQECLAVDMLFCSIDSSRSLSTSTLLQRRTLGRQKVHVQSFTESGSS